MRTKCLSLRHAGTMVVLVGLVSLMMGPTPCNLRVPEYPGSSEIPGRQDTSDVFAVEHALTMPYDAASGAPTGVRQHHPLVVVKVIDKATPGLHKACATSQNLNEVTLDWYRIDPITRVETKYYVITLRQAMIVAVEPFMPMSFLPENEAYRHMEQVSFVYQEIEWNWIPDSAVEMDTWAAAHAAADLDKDGDVDLDDFETFTGSITGPVPQGATPAGDLDSDGDCDVADLAQFTAAFTGSLDARVAVAQAPIPALGPTALAGVGLFGNASRPSMTRGVMRGIGYHGLHGTR